MKKPRYMGRRRMESPCALAVLAGLCVFPAAGAEEVTLIRDTHGVPYIFAATEAGAAYGLAMAQCEDSLDSVIYCLHAGVGRLSEIFGERMLEADVRARTLRYGLAARRAWAQLDPVVRAMVEAYSKGVNDYLARHPRELSVPVEAVTPVQVLAWNRSVMFLSEVAIAMRDAEAGGRGHGGVPPGRSNSWVLSGRRTAAGVPMLLIDPHWATEGHLQLYEAHVHGGRLEFAGFGLHGCPLPGIAVTRHAAWTFTAGGADSSDAYELRIDPANPSRYEMDGRPVAMDVRRETIRIRDGDGFRTETVEVRETRHGPVLETEAGVSFAAALGGYGGPSSLEQFYRMATARNTREFRDAIAMDRISYFNLVWATAEGDIGYVQTGKAPLRPAGYRWDRPVPGWTTGSLHRGRLPFAELPAVENPPAGFIQNCNVAANVVTTGLTFKREDFPPGVLYGHYGMYRARGQRATDLLGRLEKATLEDGRRVAFDTRVLPADLWVPVILRAHEEWRQKATGGDRAEDRQDVAAAIGLLEKWDRHATRESTGATVFRFWRLACHEMAPPVGRDGFTIPDGPEVRRDAIRALRRAVRTLKSYYGKIAVPWGEIKRLRRGQREWPLSGDGLGALGMDTLRATAGDRLDGEQRLIARGGQCVTSVVLLTDPPTIRTVVPYGQSNRPGTKHYDDQAPLYSAEKMREVPWGRSQLEGRIESRRTFHFTP